VFVADDVVEESEGYIGGCKLLLFADYDHLGAVWKMTMATYVADIDEHVQDTYHAESNHDAFGEVLSWSVDLAEYLSMRKW